MDGLLYFLFWGGLIYLMMRYGCGAHAVHGHSVGEDKDPVCGMQVSASQGYGKMYQGRLY